MHNKAEFMWKMEGDECIVKWKVIEAPGLESEETVEKEEASKSS